MDAARSPDSFFPRWQSRFCLILGLACAGFLGWFIPIDRQSNFELFKAFKVDLPKLTQIVMSIPDVYFWYGAAAACCLMIVVQCLVRANTAAVFHLLMIVICGLFFVVYRDANYEPVLALIRAVSGTRK